MVFSPSLSRGLNHRDTRIATAEFFNRIDPKRTFYVRLDRAKAGTWKRLR